MYILLMKLFRRIILVITVTVFLAAVPFAMWYNLNYDKYGSIDNPARPVFIQVCTVDTQAYNNTLRQKAAEYSNTNKTVRIFVLSLSPEQISGHEYDIKIINDDNTLHAFISPAQTEEAIRHCEKFLNNIQTQTEYKLVWKKS